MGVQYKITLSLDDYMYLYHRLSIRHIKLAKRIEKTDNECLKLLDEGEMKNIRSILKSLNGC